MPRIAAALLVALVGLAGCASDAPQPGYAKVHLETSPVDGDCELRGKGFMLATRTPADVLIPVGAAPLEVTCVKIGYKGSGVLSSSYDPWSPRNVGTLGLGYLLDKDSPAVRDLPQTFQVSMTYAEAGSVADIAITEAAKEPATPKEAETPNDAAAPTAETPAAPAAERTPEARAAMEQEMARARAADVGVPRPSAAPGEQPAATAKPLATAPAARPEQKAAAPAAATATVAAVDAFKVHLTSFRRKDHAERSWRNLLKENPKILGPLQPIVEQVDLDAKGLYYRVYAGPLEDAKAARDLCFRLKQKNLYCRPVAKGRK